MDRWKVFTPYLLQGMFVGALSVGISQLGKLAQEPIQECVKTYPRVVKYANVASTFSQFVRLSCPSEEEVQHLLRLMDMYLQYDETAPLDAQGQMSRILPRIRRRMDAICDKDMLNLTDDSFRGMLTCKDEIIPLMEAQLDDILHNHMLTHAPGAR